MNKKTAGIFSITAGTAGLLYCIMNSVDGIGRATLIFFGVALIALGSGVLYFKK